MPDSAGSALARQDFPAEFRLRETDEYSSVFAFRRVVRGRYFTLHYRPSDLLSARLGLVVAKKLARHAVLRNLVKRLAREIFRLRRASLPTCDIIVRLSAAPRKASRRELREELEQLLLKVHA